MTGWRDRAIPVDPGTGPQSDWRSRATPVEESKTEDTIKEEPIKEEPKTEAFQVGIQHAVDTLPISRTLAGLSNLKKLGTDDEGNWAITPGHKDIHWNPVELFRQGRDKFGSEIEQGATEHPVAAGVGTAAGLVGQLAIGGPTIGSGLSGAVKTAGTYGAVNALDKSKADLTKGEVHEAAKDMLVGGFVGAGTGGLLHGAGKLVSGLAKGSRANALGIEDVSGKAKDDILDFAAKNKITKLTPEGTSKRASEVFDQKLNEFGQASGIKQGATNLPEYLADIENKINTLRDSNQFEAADKLERSGTLLKRWLEQKGSHVDPTSLLQAAKQTGNNDLLKTVANSTHQGNRLVNPASSEASREFGLDAIKAARLAGETANLAKTTTEDPFRRFIIKEIRNAVGGAIGLAGVPGLAPLAAGKAVLDIVAPNMVPVVLERLAGNPATKAIAKQLATKTPAVAAAYLTAALKSGKVDEKQVEELREPGE